jgi:tyrosine-protein kinase Etk/Wzc
MIEEDLCCRQSGASPEETLDEGSARPAIEALTQLARRKWLISKVTGISVLAGLILCFALPVRYTAITSIMPPKQTQSTTSFLNSQIGMGSLADAAGGGLLKDPNAIYIGLLKSRPIADAIIQEFGLMKVYRSRDMTAARKKLENNTQVTSEKSSLISISVVDGDKQRAADMANAYTEQLRILSKTISVTEASRRRLFFEEQLKGQREALITAEVALQQVELSKGLVHLDMQANVIIGGLAALRGQIAAKQVELQALQSYSTEHNPDVQLVEREISSLQSEAAQMEQHGQPAGYSAMGLKDVPKAGLDYVRAERELQYQQSFFDLLLRQYEAARLDEAKEAAVIQVVEPAIEPERKSSPERLEIILLSAALGLFLGYVVVRYLHWMEVELSDPERARALHALRRALTGKRLPETLQADHG